VPDVVSRLNESLSRVVDVRDDFCSVEVPELPEPVDETERDESLLPPPVLAGGLGGGGGGGGLLFTGSIDELFFELPPELSDESVLKRSPPVHISPIYNYIRR
jgi:hypothetical protein